MSAAIAKLLLMPALVIVACLAAGVYGALHDQISFTISPDYFFAFKFHQFDVAPHLQNRLGAAIVGWQATWWVGAIVGLPLVSAAALFPDVRSYLKHGLLAFAIVAATAVVFGMGALIFATLAFPPNNIPSFQYPPEVIDRVAFARVGVMHNFSYLGGFLGIITGLAYLAIARWRLAGDPSLAGATANRGAPEVQEEVS